MKKRTWALQDPKIARGLIKFSWKQFAKSVPDKRPYGKVVTGIISTSRSVSKNEKIPELDAWLVVYDEFIAWWVSLVIVLFTRMIKPRVRHKQIIRACFSLSSTVLSDLLAIRHLVITGFDVPAKQLLRSLCEHLDVITLLLFKPELADEFVKTQTDKAANEFWYRYVAKGKAKKLIYSDHPELAEWRQFRRSEDGVLSMSAHPSHIAGVVAGLVPDEKSIEEFWPAYFGVKSRASVRTLRYATSALFEFIAVGNELPFGGKKLGFPIVPYDSTDNFHQHLKDGRIVLAMLMIFISSLKERKTTKAKHSKHVA